MVVTQMSRATSAEMPITVLLEAPRAFVRFGKSSSSSFSSSFLGGSKSSGKSIFGGVNPKKIRLYLYFKLVRKVAPVSKKFPKFVKFLTCVSIWLRLEIAAWPPWKSSGGKSVIFWQHDLLDVWAIGLDWLWVDADVVGWKQFAVLFERVARIETGSVSAPPPRTRFKWIEKVPIGRNYDVNECHAVSDSNYDWALYFSVLFLDKWKQRGKYEFLRNEMTKFWDLIQIALSGSLHKITEKYLHFSKLAKQASQACHKLEKHAVQSAAPIR
jgi:hypothetical protein